MRSHKRNNQKGFTLLEVIVVIIILGVLATVALPRLFSNIEFSRSAEALNAMGVLRQSIERCGLIQGSYATCNDFANLDMANPSIEAGSHFDYTIAINDAAEGDYVITATRNATLDNGDGTSTITLTVDAEPVTGGGSVTRAGTGVFGAI